MNGKNIKNDFRLDSINNNWKNKNITQKGQKGKILKIDRMDNNNYAEHGHVSLIVTLLSGVFAWLSSHEFGEVIRTTAGLIAIISGVMAVRYYYYATKKQKQNDKQG